MEQAFTTFEDSRGEDKFWSNWDEARESGNDVVMTYYNDLYNYKLNPTDPYLREAIIKDVKQIDKLPKEWRQRFKDDARSRLSGGL